jgi:RNA polymerase sigma factor (sigma-70 family)
VDELIDRGDGGVVVHEVGDACGTADLLGRAAQGDQQAWRELVDLNGAVVWAAARAYSSNITDAEDVCQATWLLLAENLDRLRTPEALTGWLVTTARRESIRLVRARHREAPSGLDSAVLDVGESAEDPESKAVQSMITARMWQAFAGLSHQCQQLLRVIAVAPEASYAQVSEALGIARGTIGPKKNRCLTALRKLMTSTDLPEEAAG